MDPHVCAAWCVPLSLRLPKICMTAAPRPRACVQSGERKTQEAPTEPCEKPHQAEILLNNVHLAFNKKPVLSGVNLKIWPGEATAIIGTSGTGKSTLLRVITGLELPDSGDVIIRGWKRKEHIQIERGNLRMSMVFQSAALFDSMSVAENVGFRLIHENKLSDERIYDLVLLFLRRVGLEGAMDKYPEQLSGGMRRRIALARAVIYDPDDPTSAPDIMLYDEPTAGLDPTASTRIENIIRDLQNVCPTCVIVTHQFSTIRRTADRVVLLHDGRVAWDGPVADLDTTDNRLIRQFMSGSLDGPLTNDDNKVD